MRHSRVIGHLVASLGIAVRLYRAGVPDLWPQATGRRAAALWIGANGLSVFRVQQYFAGRNRSRPHGHPLFFQALRWPESGGGLELICTRVASVGVRFQLERRQGFSQLFALGKGRSPVLIVADAVQANGFAGEQCVGDQSDGHFRDRPQGAVGAGHGEFQNGLAHVISLGTD